MCGEVSVFGAGMGSFTRWTADADDKSAALVVATVAAMMPTIVVRQTCVLMCLEGLKN